MRILIADDGSEFAIAAVDLAGDIIRGDRETQVKIVTVIEPAAGTEIETLIESVDDLARGPEARRVAQSLETSVERLRAKSANADLDITYEVLAGPAARTIVEHADQWRAGLIIVGTHGRGWWQKALLGSVSSSVTRHANCSVLIARSVA